ncbi:hypothetical protein ANCCEY_04286 [Ancylostoma ceylanicum]|uniref:SCP domain-containing protein n=1 Tax=Ancylostoma ceylanicum TaxID=53326 RepID=A0A0D6M2V9_9BILA|nr:hypothetical protein ANCCEY_04286 [Ancylostoma ceylanicum]
MTYFNLFSPKLGSPLYWDNSNDQKGCTAATTCKEAIAGATTSCEAAQGLCKTTLTTLPTTTAPPTTGATSPSADSSTASSAPSDSSSASTGSSAATPSTTPSAAATSTTPAETMTPEIRNKIIDMHNYRRSIVAKGTVRNGKEGNPNCPAATNMYHMRYDIALEREAQAYADTCTTVGSAVSTRPNSGENVYTSPSTTIPFYDAFVEVGKHLWN